ncbi:hypothetical protein H6G36_29175 [Anabaena minutissima FACHB-250]|nr:hypothetical protein [Anabaena minutissima FACHB-250]
MPNKTIDTLTTILGLIAGTSTLLGGFGVIDPHTSATTTGVATAILGYFVQRPSKPIS